MFIKSSFSIVNLIICKLGFPNVWIISKLGYGPDLIWMNQRLINLTVETLGNEVRLKFSSDLVGPALTEKIQPGVLVEDEEYQAIWYRSVGQH